MQYRSLGRTGIKVSPYALGAMMLGAPAIGNPDHEDGIRIIHKALDAGINFLDTADRYSNGESEVVVGEALKGRRDEVVLATKFYGPIDDDPNQKGNSRRWIMTEAANSLRRLQTDHIDLYQLHRPDPDTDIDETLSALTDLIRRARSGRSATSSMPGSDIVEAQWVAERRGFERFRTEQPNYSILDREIEPEILPVAQRYGMGTLVYSPLAGGDTYGSLSAGQETDLRSRRPACATFGTNAASPPSRAHRARRRSGCEADAPCDGVRHRASRGHHRDRRTADDGAAGGHARRHRRQRCPTTSSTVSTRLSRPAPTSAYPINPPTSPRHCERADLRRRPVTDRSAA